MISSIYYRAFDNCYSTLTFDLSQHLFENILNYCSAVIVYFSVILHSSCCIFIQELLSGSDESSSLLEL